MTTSRGREEEGHYKQLHRGFQWSACMCLLYFLNIFWRKYAKLESLNKAGCSLCYSLYLSLCEDNYNRRYLVFENHNVDHWIWWPPSLDSQLRDSKKINFQNKVCENDKLWVRFLKFTYTFGAIRILKTIEVIYMFLKSLVNIWKNDELYFTSINSIPRLIKSKYT